MVHQAWTSAKMVIRFFRTTIKGTDENKLKLIRSWILTKIENNDLSKAIKKNSEISLWEEEENLGNYVLDIDLYIKRSVSMNKYKDIIKNKWPEVDKEGLTHAKVIQYDNCSHDENNPQPCEPTVRMEWTA